MFLRFAKEVGAIDEEKRLENLKFVREGLSAAAGEMRTNRQEELDPADLFLSLVRAAMTRGTAYVSDMATDSCPEGREVVSGWKWSPRPTPAAGWAGAWGTGPNSERIGWTDGETVYFQVQAAYSAARQMAEEGGQGLGFGQRNLAKMLLEAGKVSPDKGVGEIRGGKTRYTTKIFLKSHRQQMDLLPIPASVLWGDETDEPRKPAAQETGVGAPPELNDGADYPKDPQF